MPTYNSWAAIFQRCYNSKSPSYWRYGGRGITVCERWRKFSKFVQDMGLRPDGRTLDREDNNGNYEPGNCRWATRMEQNRNKRTNRIISIRGVTGSFAEVAEHFGIDYHLAFGRWHTLKWDLEAAFFTPKQLSS